jgi:LPXTG-motif cell wall-anchored protein
VGHLGGAALAVAGLLGFAAISGAGGSPVGAVDVDEKPIEEVVTWSPVCVDGDEQLRFVVQQEAPGLVLVLADNLVVFFGFERELTSNPLSDAGDIVVQADQVSTGLYDVSGACDDEPTAPDPEEEAPEEEAPESDESESDDTESDSAETLPETGPSSSLWIALGGGLALVSGAALTAATRRRA